MGRVPFSAPAGSGFGAVDVAITATVAAGSSEGVNIISGTGEFIRLVSVDLQAPAITGSTGTHEFRVVSGTGTQTVVAQSAGTSDIDVDGVAFVVADSLQKPTTDVALAEALNRTVGSDTQALAIGYHNDTDTDQTGQINIEATTVRGSEL